MGTLNEDLSAIKEVEDKIVSNKVARFAYTNEAYKTNDADGVDEYDVNNAQNIPTADASVLKVNETVLSKGYRAQASSITRMLVNHFFGRMSYNLNKVNDNVSNLIATLIGHRGTANGFATLDENGRIPYSQLPESVMEYKGQWNAETNTPTLADGTGTKGDFYIVSVSGTQNLGSGNIQFFENDRIIYDGSVWSRLSAGDVKKVNNVLPTNGNVALTGENIPVSATNATLLSAPLTTDRYADSSVTTEKIADNAVTNAKIKEPISVAKGGTGKTTPKGAQNALLSDMQTETTAIDDSTEFVMKYGAPTDTKGALFKRSATLVWNYIKDKISSVLGLTATAYGGKASTAEIADKTVNDITIDIPYVQEGGQYVIPLGNIPEPTSTAVESPYNWDITGFFSIIRPAGHVGSHMNFEAGHGYSHNWTTYAYLDAKYFSAYDAVLASIKAFQYNGKWWLGLSITTKHEGYVGKMTITYSRGLPATPTCVLYNSQSDGVANAEIYNSIQDIPSSWWRGRTIYNPTTFTQNITAPVIQAETFIGNVSGTATTADKVKNALTINGQSFDGSSPVTLNISSGTDTKVAQTVSTSNNKYPILASATANKSYSGTEEAIFSTLLSMNPSTGNMTGWSNGSAYAICASGPDLSEKIVELPGLTLTPGMTVTVLFIYGNKAVAPSLNVNYRGEKQIRMYLNGGKTIVTTRWDAGTSMTLMYDGTDFIVLGNPVVMSKFSETSSYIKYANGLIIQWGHVVTRTSKDRTETITFPISYTQIPALNATWIVDNMDCYSRMNILSISTTQAKIRNTDHTTNGYTWMSIGW